MLTTGQGNRKGYQVGRWQSQYTLLMLHDKNRAFVQEAQQDNTSYSQARLQRGQTEGRNFALYTRETSNQRQRSRRRPITKALLTFPVVFRKALWHTAHSNKCLFYLHYIIFYEVDSQTHATERIQNTHTARYALQSSATYAQTAHWHLVQSQSQERSEVVAESASILQPQPYILSNMKACSRGQQ